MSETTYLMSNAEWEEFMKFMSNIPDEDDWVKLLEPTPSERNSMPIPVLDIDLLLDEETQIELPITVNNARALVVERHSDSAPASPFIYSLPGTPPQPSASIPSHADELDALLDASSPFQGVVLSSPTTPRTPVGKRGRKRRAAPQSVRSGRSRRTRRSSCHDDDEWTPSTADNEMDEEVVTPVNVSAKRKRKSERSSSTCTTPSFASSKRRCFPEHASFLPISGRCHCQYHKCYVQPTMPEQSKHEEKKTFVVFYCKHVHSPTGATLVLQPSTPGMEIVEIKADRDLSWTATGDVGNGELMVQHKFCFTSPYETFNREIFSATFYFSSAIYAETYIGTSDFEEPCNAEYEQLAMELGPVSFVSTTSQREKFWPAMAIQCSTEQQRKLITNFCAHHPSRRHFINGKGTRQHVRTRPQDWFRLNEYDQAVLLPTPRVSVSA